MMTIAEGVEFLLRKYSVPGSVTPGPGALRMTVGGRVLPLLPWRGERRFTEFRNLVREGYLRGLSTVRVCHVAPAGTDLWELLYRETDICEWVSGETVCEIFAVRGERALNAIAVTGNGVVFTLELAATLAAGVPDVDKHEVIAERGVICDRAVDTQVPQSSVYVLGASGTREEYTDVDAELYGMSAGDVAAVRQMFAVVRDGLDLTREAEHLCQVVAAARLSAEREENVFLPGRRNEE